MINEMIDEVGFLVNHYKKSTTGTGIDRKNVLTKTNEFKAVIQLRSGTSSTYNDKSVQDSTHKMFIKKSVGLTQSNRGDIIEKQSTGEKYRISYVDDKNNNYDLDVDHILVFLERDNND